ncbi:adhesion G-protein coupled receptor G6 isoform X16 [Xenopus laevis]|uniref:Adhesion G-protein coupled receptor G6 n=1 Tax=Xenopus laevis TaxID=8355 RepID=A0A8J0VAW1_XENLA|nr:adhesion G-protein coupled receptor G6 isoform X16 [Xenopus laevis]
MIFQISGLWCSHWKWKMQYILLSFVVYIAYVQHSVSCCTVCKLTLTATTGNVTSPCYSQLYPNNQDCKWILQAPRGFIIQLTFVDFDVEEAQNCVYDYVSISNGETTTKYCGVTARGLTYNSTGNMMNISFFSDFSIQRKGFNATYKHVPVSLRNLKVTIPQKQSLGIVSVTSTVLVPALSQFTVCFEATRFRSSPAEWKALTYWNSLTELLSFGKTASGHFVYISGIQCPLNLTLSSSTATGEFFTETLQEVCITWDSRSGLVGVKTLNTFQTSTCLDTKNIHIPGNGSLMLGCYDNKTSSLQGDIYNFRLWDTAFDSVALSNLSCDQKGNIVTWENDFWSIPSWARKAGTDLSCGTTLSSTPSTVTTTCKNLGGVCQATLSTASPFPLSPTNSFDRTTNYSTNSATLSTDSPSPLSPTNSSDRTTNYSTNSATYSTVSTTTFNTSNLNDTTYSSSSATVTSDFSSTLNNMINTTTSNATLSTASPSPLSPTNSFDRTTNYSTNSATVTSDFSSTLNNMINATTSNAATSSPSTMITINMNDTNHINNSQPGGTFYRISITVVNYNLDNESEVQRTVSDWLKQSLQNWSYAVFLLNMSIHQTNSEFVRDARSLLTKSMQHNHKRRARDISNKSFDVWALLVYNNSNNVVLETKTIYDKLLQNNDSIGDGLSLHAVNVYSVEPCMAEEYPSSYFWPNTRPTVIEIIPCPKSSVFNASRKCSVGLHNYSSYWETPNTDNCTDLTVTEDAENAANELLNMTGNGQVLTSEKVNQVVQKLKQIVNDANISASLGSTVVNVFSNLLSSPDDLLAKSSSDALKTIETLALKVQFTGPSVSILSPNLALGVSRVNSTLYTGSSFSVGSNTSSSGFEVNMEKSQNSSLASVVLPSSLLSNLSESDFYTVSRAQFTFFNKSGLFQDSQIASGDQMLISYVVACSIGNITIKNLADPVKIIVKHKSQGTNQEKTCVFWDTERNNGKGGWNTYGCTVVKQESTVNETVCLCNHLTHFGILMDLQRTSQLIDQQNTRILTFITYIGCGISAICTAATLLTYIAFEKIRRDYPSKILMNLSTALLFLNLFFLLDGWIASFGINELCITVAVLLHFFLLATFTWMGLEAVHMYIALVKVFNTYIRRYMLKFCIIGWGLPAIIVSVVLASTHSNIAYGSSSYGQDSRGNGGDEFCWIKSDTVFYVTCAAYFAIVFLMNVAMFIVVMVQICGRNGKRTNRSIREEVLRNLRSVVSLTFLLGMTWGFAFFAWGPVNLAFMYLFTIFNSLQGLFIFVFHCALKENVQKQWRRHLCCGKLRLTDNSDWSKTATNNTKKVSSDNLGKSLSSSSIGSNSTYLTSKSKSSTKPFFKRNSGAGYIFGDRPSVKFTAVDGEQTSILPVHHVIDKVKGYYNSHSDNFYKNIIMSESYSKSTKF